MEVPEIYDGTVVIRAIAREAGERTKVAVYSKDPDVDCVGACVGMKGMRVQSIIRELRGEKIDIIEFNEDISTFAANALSPAKINHVTILDPEQKHLEVIVDDTQLSLAIGKKGQNVRLAARLLGWRIDIKSEEEKRQEIESQMEAMALRGAAVTELQGLGEKTLQKLKDHGIETVEQLAQMTPDDLMQIQGVGEKTVERIRRVVTDYFERDRESASAIAAAEEAQAATEEPAPATLEEITETARAEESVETEQGEPPAQDLTAQADSGEEPRPGAETDASAEVSPPAEVGAATEGAEETAASNAAEHGTGEGEAGEEKPE
jgi:transcription termination/antitermination protein NusA